MAKSSKSSSSSNSDSSSNINLPKNAEPVSKTYYVVPNGAACAYHNGIPVIPAQSLTRVPSNTNGIIYKLVATIPEVKEKYYIRKSVNSNGKSSTKSSAGIKLKPTKSISKSSSASTKSSSGTTAYHLFVQVLSQMTKEYKKKGYEVELDSQQKSQLWDSCKSILDTKLDPKRKPELISKDIKSFLRQRIQISK